MNQIPATKKQLLAEVEALRQRVGLLEEAARRQEQDKVELQQYRLRLDQLVEERTRQLRQSAEHYRLLLDASPDPITVYDHLGMVAYVNPAFEQTFGWTLAELRGRGLDFVPDHEKEKTRDAVERTLRGENVLLETQRLTKDGRLLDIQLKTAVFLDAQGKLAGDIVIYRDLTEHAQAQAALKESEARFRTLMEATPDAVVVYDAQGQVSFLNPAFEHLYGRSLAELRGRRIDNFVPPEEGEKTSRAWARTLAGEKLVFETRRKAKDGRVLEVQLRTSILTGTDGRHSASIVTHRDLSEQRRAEKAIDDARQLLADIIDFLPDATLVIDRQGRVISWNKALEKLTGVPAAQMIGKGEYEYAVPFRGQRRPIVVDLALNPDQEVPEGYLSISKKGDKWHAESYRPHLKPGGVYLAITARRLYDHAGEVAGAIECIRDVSAYKLAVEELKTHRAHLEDLVEERTRELTKANMELERQIATRKQSERELYLERERFRLLLEGGPLGIALVSQDGVFEYVNQRFSDMFGYEREEIPTSKTLLPKWFPDADYRGSVVSTWKQDQQTPLGRQGVSREIRVTCRDGSEKTIEFISVAQESGDYIFIFEDITERKKAEAEKEKLEAQLRQAQKMEAIGTLAGGIAHDFNNILGAIIGYAQLAQMQPLMNARVSGYLEGILKAAARATDLITQILTFSRQVELKSVPVQVKTVLKEVAKLLGATLPKTIEIKENIASDAKVLADPVHIHQVIMNLCTNAAHAMREKGGVLEIALNEVEVDHASSALVRGLAPGRYQVIIVADTGHGMDKATQERIFDPFFTTKPVGEGTGLGLAVVHGIVQNLGGIIKTYSEPERGTAFHVYLPTLLSETEMQEPQFESAPIRGGHERILIVDDEEMLVEVAREMLAPLGYRVTAKTSGREALEVFLARPDEFDVVITDLTMPGISGVEMARKMLRVRSDMPIILCTGFSESISSEDCGRIGIKKFLMKPLTSGKLAQAINEVLER